MYAAQLLADLGNFPAHQSEFIAARSEAFDFRRRRVVLSRGDAVQLRRDAPQWGERRTAYERRQQGGNYQRNQHERRGRAQAWLDLFQQDSGVERHADFPEWLSPFAERIVKLENFRRSPKHFYLMEEISLHQLRKSRSSRQKCSRQGLIGRNQHHPVMVNNRHFVNQRIVFRGFELRAQSFVDFESMSYVIVNFLRSVRCRAQTLFPVVRQRVLRLQKHLARQVVGSHAGGLQELLQELRREYARQDRRDEQHQARHHQCEFCPQPQLHSASLLRFGALAAVFFQLIMKCFQADAEQLRRPGFVVPGCAQRLHDEFALHRINRRPHGKLDRRKIARPFPRRLSELSRQARARNQIFLAHDGRALQYIAQLADVSRPGVSHENIHHFRADPSHMLPMLGVHVAQNMLDEPWNIVLMLTQRRQVDVKHIQPEIKILPQMAAADGLLGFFVCRRKNAHVHRCFTLASKPPHFAVFQNAQQLRLRRRGHFADFIQQQRSRIRKLEAPDAPLGRAREGPSLVAKNLALHQCFRNRGTIDRHKRSVGPRRKLVQSPCDEFLARSRLTRDQHRCRARRGHLHDAHHFLHRLRRPDQVPQSSRFPELPLQHRQLPRISRLAQRPVQQRVQHRPLQRLLDVPERPRLDRRHCPLFTPLAGNDDGRHIVQFRPELLQQIQSIHPRQFDVRDQRVRLVTRKFRQRFFRRCHAYNVAAPPLQKLFVALSRIVLIFDNQHAVLPLHHLDGPHRPPCLFPHGSQPLFGLLLMNGLRTDLLDTSTLTSHSRLAKFLAVC